MGFYKSNWVNDYNLLFYLRYVDYILAAFGKEQDSLNFLNNRHLDTEKQINHSIAFLVAFISDPYNKNLIL